MCKIISVAAWFILSSILSSSFSKDSLELKAEQEFEILPILSYDSNSGFGYGGKLFFLNFLNDGESFDIILFNSTKGERWYRLKFSLPDNEIRQGKEFSFAFDFIIDYDKRINYSFFGIGQNSLYQNEFNYTREPVDISLFLSRAFTKTIITDFGIRYNATSNYRVSAPAFFNELNGGKISGLASLLSLLLRLRHDSRTSVINPRNGEVIQLELENAVKTSYTNSGFFKLELTLQHYYELISDLISANRIICRQIFGDKIPLHYLCTLGGNQTLRGYSENRFLDKAFLLLNSELRVLIFWRFGGIIGFDAGKVSSSISRFSFSKWAINPLIGLRFYMDNFVVRFDAGLGPEEVGYYLNFNHLF